MLKTILAQFRDLPGTVVGYGIDAVGIVENQINGADPFRIAYRQPGVVGIIGGDGVHMVKEPGTLVKALVRVNGCVVRNVTGCAGFFRAGRGHKEPQRAKAEQ